LTEAGSGRHYLNGGGDIRCAGGREDGQPWRFGIADPVTAGKLAAVVTGSEFALATSGTTERGAHVLNPHTKRPAAGLLSVSLTGPELTRVDAYATAAFAMGPAARDWVETLDHIEAFGVAGDGSSWETTGWGSLD
jgi:thiamine biosynthesis lipoprotein